MNTPTPASIIRKSESRGVLISVCLSSDRAVAVVLSAQAAAHTSMVKVRGGFAGKEFSALWSAGDDWHVSEGQAGFFSHYFVAKRNG
jgi:hypothetical protein